MLKRTLRWIVPLLALLLIALSLVISPMLVTHAAGPVAPAHSISSPSAPTPYFFWRP